MRIKITLLALVAGLTLPMVATAHAESNPPAQRSRHDDSVRPRHHHRGFDGYGERWARYGDRIVRAADPTDPRG